MARNVENTIAELKQLALKHDSVLVGFSGGKDSLVLLDLACRFFKRVVPFFMYLVPGLQFERDRLRVAKDRYGLDVIEIPHYRVWNDLKAGTYCDFFTEFEDMPDVHYWSYYKLLMQDTDCSLLMDGVKKADGSFRRRNLANETEEQRRMRLHPIRYWLKWEVLSYCKARNLPIPQQQGMTAAGNGNTGLAVQDLLWLHDNHPLDFKKVAQVFPYVYAAIARRDFFGLNDG
jgi:phosphoadenosine phosphosulfate reductase